MCRDENSAINIKNLGLGQSYVEIMSDSSSEEQLSMKQEAITSTMLGYGSSRENKQIYK